MGLPFHQERGAGEYMTSKFILLAALSAFFIAAASPVLADSVSGCGHVINTTGTHSLAGNLANAYSGEGCIVLNASSITLDCGGNSINASGTNIFGTRLATSTITIQNCYLKSDNSGAQTGIELGTDRVGITTVTIDNNDINVTGVGIVINGSTVTINNNRINTTNNAIHIGDSSFVRRNYTDWTITNNRIVSSVGTGILGFFPDRISDVQLLNNNVQAISQFGLSRFAVALNVSSDITVNGNTFLGMVRLASRNYTLVPLLSGIAVYNNTFRGNATGGLQIDGNKTGSYVTDNVFVNASIAMKGDNNLVSGNTLTNGGISIVVASNSTLQDNVLSGGSISVTSATDNTITRNVLTGLISGITSSGRSTITSNRASATASGGISLIAGSASTAGSIIHNNNVSSASNEGIFVSAVDTNVTSNIVHTDFDIGIDVLGTGISVIGNNVTSAGSAIRMFSASSNLVFNNNLTSSSSSNPAADITSTSSFNNFTNNIIASTGPSSGISISSSPSNFIFGNNITAFSGVGVDIAFSPNNTITGNNVTSKYSTGVRVAQTNSTLIFNNTISGGGDGSGIHTRGASHTRIIGNNITRMNETQLNESGGLVMAVEYTTVSFAVEAFNGAWHGLGEYHFSGKPSGYRYSRQEIALPEGTTRVRLIHDGETDTAHIDSVLLDGNAPYYAYYLHNGEALSTAKFAGADYDVVEAAAKAIELMWTGPGSVLSVSAIEEDFRGTKLKFPVDGGFLNYTIGEQKAFTEIWHPYTSHPNGTIYADFSADEESLAVNLDVTIDNTLDYGGDWAAIQIPVSGEVKEFVINSTTPYWGTSAFTYTDKAPWQHKIYSFKIPLSELGSSHGATIQFQFRYYGTGGGPPPAPVAIECTNNTVINNFASGNGSAGMALFGCTNSTFINNTAVSLFGPGAFLNQSENNSFTSSTFYSNQSKGLMVKNSARNDFINITISSNFSAAIEIVADMPRLASSGRRSAKAGTILDSQESNLTLSQSVPAGGGNISFAFRVSSESGADFLRFYIDGFLNASYSGEIAWQTARFNITAGDHNFTWRYVKDGSVSSGSDTAWADDVRITDSSGVSVFSDGFEDGTLSPFTTAGNANWTIENETGDNRFINSTLFTNNSWIFAMPNGTINLFENTLFEAANTSARIISNFTITAEANVSQERLNLSYNRTYMNATNLSFMSTTSRITFRNLTLANPQPIRDAEDDNSFVICGPPQCTEVGYGAGTFVFDVTGFTTYSSSETIGIPSSVINFPANNQAIGFNLIPLNISGVGDDNESVTQVLVHITGPAPTVINSTFNGTGANVTWNVSWVPGGNGFYNLVSNASDNSGNNESTFETLTVFVSNTSNLTNVFCFSNCNISSSNISGSNLTGGSATGCAITGSVLINTTCTNSVITNSNLTNCSVTGTSVSNTVNSSCSLPPPSGAGAANSTSQGEVMIGVQTIASLLFAINTVNWGVGNVNQSGGNINCVLDTEGSNVPSKCINFTTVTQPFVIENDGSNNLSVQLTFSKNATQFIGGSSPLFRYRVASNESGSCTEAPSPANYTDVNTTSPGTLVCTNMPFLNNVDTLAVHINITIPFDASPGTKTAIVTATGTTV
jgi:parallel beta-helix repeat protein